MKSVSSNVAPISIQTDLCGRSLGSGHLKEARGDLESSISGNDLDAGNPFGELATFTSCNISLVGGVFGVD